MKLLTVLFAVLLLSGCFAKGSGKRVDITIINTTGEELELQAKAGIFKTKIELEPGKAWNGWVPVIEGFTNDVQIVIKKK